MRADVVVVGAGAAGSVMARRLAEAGADVILLEAGSEVASSRAGLLDVGPASRVVTRHRARLAGAEVELPRGHTLGGSGAVNGGYCSPARPADLAGWGPGWPQRYAVGLARASERLRPVLAPPGPVAARVAEVFPERMSAIAQARRGDRRVTAFDAWDPVGAGVRVVTGAPVERVRWHGDVVGGRCDGVVLAAGAGAGGGEDTGGGSDDDAVAPGTEITAREVVLCAGTIGTAAILRASGLGPATGHPVGERVEEHPEVLLDLPAEWAVDTEADASPGEGALVPLLSHVARIRIADGGMGSGPECGPGGVRDAGPDAAEVEVRPYAVPLHRVIPGMDPVPLRLGIALMTPAGCGRIDRDGTVWLPDDPRDAAVLGAASGLVAAALGLDGGDPVPSTSHHLSGSARMGEVVDSGGRVLGTVGLRVADASVFPELPRCGPYYSVLAVAEVLAQAVCGERSW